MNDPFNPLSTPRVETPPELPQESLVVLALDVESLVLATELANRKMEGFGGQIVIVCRAGASTVAPTHQSVVIVSVAADVTAEEARRIGVARAAGDVIRVVAARTGRRRTDSAPWTERLAKAGVRRAGQRTGQP